MDGALLGKRSMPDRPETTPDPFEGAIFEEVRPGPLDWCREKWAWIVGSLQYWWRFGRHDI